MKLSKNDISDYSKKFLAAGKTFLKSPLTYMIGIPVWYLNKLNKNVLEMITETPVATVIVFSAIYFSLLLFTYFKGLYDKLNKIIVIFEKEKGKMAETHRKNLLGSVDVFKKDGNMVLNVKIHLLDEYSKVEPIPAVKTRPKKTKTPEKPKDSD